MDKRTMDNIHTCQEGYRHLAGMREFYHAAGMIATSDVATIALIRSYIAYHVGNAAAERASIKPSRGHSYRVAWYGKHGKDDQIVKIRDYYDHRAGVLGLYTGIEHI